MAIIRVMTFNIHGNDPEWTALHADLTLGVIQRYSADLIGLQEVVTQNIEFYRQHLIDYVMSSDRNMVRKRIVGILPSFGGRHGLSGWSLGIFGSVKRPIFVPAIGECRTP